MKKIIIICCILSIGLLAGCSLHDEKGWEHTGEGKTDASSAPYLLEHEH